MSSPQPFDHRVQPPRSAVANHPRLTTVSNPLAMVMIGALRDAQTPTLEFERVAADLAAMSLWSACERLPLVADEAPGFSGASVEIMRFAERVGGVVIPRAGMLFARAFRHAFPGAPLYQVGARRDEQTLEAHVYACNLPEHPDWADRVFIMDPMLATGGSALAAIARVRRCHAGPIELVSLIAAPFGVDAVLRADERTHITTVALDEGLNEHGFIVPGLGDAGDRAFGTTSS